MAHLTLVFADLIPPDPDGIRSRARPGSRPRVSADASVMDHGIAEHASLHGGRARDALDAALDGVEQVYIDRTEGGLAAELKTRASPSARARSASMITANSPPGWPSTA